MRVAAWYRGTPQTKVHQIRGTNVDWPDPNAAKFHHARPNDVREKELRKFVTPFSIFATHGDPLAKVHQSWHYMYRKAVSISLPNFVSLWQPVYEISAAELRRFR